MKASSPTVTAATLAGNVITFTGTNFPASSAYTAKAYFKSAGAIVTSWSATSATVTFTNGVSATVTGETAVPRIEF